ncbi:uncharacterized protein LOC114269855 [Camellia sinensis]|uniref:uncharacterized protein LOC114269855 n=1 Tax=Camellia sinensis TaxID=4442 RepID=UPI001035B448|nr:uncharacterized protein LOC114269855 [Camellia sinensis]
MSDNDHLGEPSSLVPSKEDSCSGGEILQTDQRDLNSKLQVYTRKRFHMRNNDSNVHLSSGTETSGNPIPSISDLDVPIAIRKGVRNCIKHPIANYLSYQRLTKNHRAFTSRISHFFVSRNIQEALDDLNWKLAVMEEMNALKRNGTWEIVDLPKGKKIVGC